MKKQKNYYANIRDVARQANVSIATVSRYINSPEKLSEETRLTVGHAIADLGYIPNAIARAVFCKSAKNIGLIVPSITNPFFAELVTAIEINARESNDAILLKNTYDNKLIEEDSLKYLLEHRVSAIIVCRSHSADLYNDIDVPVVCFENPVNNCHAIVNVDNERGGYQAFKHLYDLGCRRILHIKGPSDFKATEDRCLGFLKGCNEIPKAYRPEVSLYQLTKDFAFESSDLEIDNIPKLDSYDGIFVFNDAIATSLLRVLNRRHINVPSQIRVIGFDGSFWSQMTAPALSTVTQHVELIAKHCVDAVRYLRSFNEVLAKLESPVTYTVSTDLLARESTVSG